MSDFLLSKRKWRVVVVRKTFQTIALLVPGFALLTIGAAQTNAAATIFLMCVAVSATGAFSSGCVANFRDLFGPLAAPVFAISNGIAQYFGLIAISTVGPLVERFGWSAPFYFAFVANCVGAGVFLAFGKADLVIPAVDGDQTVSLVSMGEKEDDEHDET